MPEEDKGDTSGLCRDLFLNNLLMSSPAQATTMLHRHRHTLKSIERIATSCNTNYDHRKWLYSVRNGRGFHRMGNLNTLAAV